MAHWHTRICQNTVHLFVQTPFWRSLTGFDPQSMESHSAQNGSTDSWTISITPRLRILKFPDSFVGWTGIFMQYRSRHLLKPISVPAGALCNNYRKTLYRMSGKLAATHQLEHVFVSVTFAHIGAIGDHILFVVSQAVKGQSVPVSIQQNNVSARAYIAGFETLLKIICNFDEAFRCMRTFRDQHSLPSRHLDFTWKNN